MLSTLQALYLNRKVSLPLSRLKCFSPSYFHYLPAHHTQLCASVFLRTTNENAKCPEAEIRFILTNKHKMSAYKQAGISLNRALAIQAKAVRSALNSKAKLAAEKRGFAEVKAVRIEKGVQQEAKALAE